MTVSLKCCPPTTPPEDDLVLLTHKFANLVQTLEGLREELGPRGIQHVATSVNCLQRPYSGGEGDTSTGLQTDPTEDESEVSDILSSDSDESSLDEFKAKLETEQLLQNRTHIYGEKKRTKRDEELERMYFYSIYIDNMPSKEQQLVAPQTSEDVDNCKEYDEATRKALFDEAAQFVIDETDEEKFNEILKTEIDESDGMEDIDGNISIRTMCEHNYKTLRMDGPSRRVALLFSYKPGDRPISYNFLHFMQQQKERYPFISGVLLYYSNYGVHFVEGSEYVLLMYFPAFFKAECFKKLSKCKVLAVEDLSAMKYFEHYSCYKGNPPKSNINIPHKRESSTTALSYIRQIGIGLNVFLKHVYQDFPNVTDDNVLPSSVESKLPPSELIEFALRDKQWEPGLRDVKQWFSHLTYVPGDTDNSEFVWPLRSDMMPVHLFHPAEGEEEMLKTDLIMKMSAKRLKDTTGEDD